MGEVLCGDYLTTPTTSSNYLDHIRHMGKVLVQRGGVATEPEAFCITQLALRDYAGVADPVAALALICDVLPPDQFMVQVDGRTGNYLVSTL